MAMEVRKIASGIEGWLGVRRRDPKVVARARDALAAMSLEEWALRSVIKKPFQEELDPEFYCREICVTPFEGRYDEPAGYVICVRGTPPRGAIFVSPPRMILHPMDGSRPPKSLGIKQCSAVMRYLEHRLAGDKNLARLRPYF